MFYRQNKGKKSFKQNEVLPKIDRNFNLTKLVAEREYKETSQLYKYIDDSIAHATSAIIKTINNIRWTAI